MMDMSVFETLEEGKEKRGWLMTEIQVYVFLFSSYFFTK